MKSDSLRFEVTKLVFEYMKDKNPLAASIPRDASLSLCKSLRQRLNASETRLDFSPASLKEIEALLIEYKINHVESMTDLETLILIRELAAYIGEVLVRYSDGQWVLLDDSIWGTRLKYDSQWSLLKENKKQSISAVSYSLGDLAASAWQSTLDGESLQLFKTLKDIRRKTLKERLTYTK